MIQDVIVQKLHISKMGEQHYFQINVPRLAEKIVGVELGAFFQSIVLRRPEEEHHFLRIKRNPLVGEINLQTSNQPNFFYAAELVQQDKNIGADDLLKYNEQWRQRGRSQEPPYNPVSPDPFWKSEQSTHGGRKELDEILIDEQRTIYGCYKDLIGVRDSINYSYTVLLYVWYQINE